MAASRRSGVTGAVAMLLTATAVSFGAGDRPGTVPDTPWSCPATHPIKGYVSRESGLRVYHVPGGAFYEETSPERCYASEDEAARDGSRPTRDVPLPAAPSPPVVRASPGRDRGEVTATATPPAPGSRLDRRARG